MNYIENSYICLAAPLLLAVMCLRGNGRRSLAFVLSGMTVCLLSAYISTFLADAAGVDLITASHEISPAVEEIMKSLPLLFYILVFEPDRSTVIPGALLVSVGFAEKTQAQTTINPKTAREAPTTHRITDKT